MNKADDEGGRSIDGSRNIVLLAPRGSYSDLANFEFIPRAVMDVASEVAPPALSAA